MVPLVGCPAPGVFFSALALAAVAVGLGGVVVKTLLSQLHREERPGFWGLVGVSLADPVAYLALGGAYVALARHVWAFEYVPLVVVALGAVLAFAVSAGLHGSLLGRANPAIGEWRRTWLSAVYAAVVPVMAVLPWMAFLL